MFVLLAGQKDIETGARKGKALVCLGFADIDDKGEKSALYETSGYQEAFPEIKLDMFFFVSMITIIMVSDERYFRPASISNTYLGIF